MPTLTLTHFEQQYVESMLWSTTCEKFGECPCCGEPAPLSHQDEDGEACCGDCSEKELNSEPNADRNYSVCDLSPEAIETIKRDCTRFLELAGELTNEENYIGSANPDNIAAHDFWLTRNGHGVGFWDGDWTTGEALTAIAERFGEQYLSVDDNGQLILEGGTQV